MTFFTEDTGILVNLNERLSIQCRDVSREGYILWTKDDLPLPLYNNLEVIKISRIERSSYGTYRCIRTVEETGQKTIYKKYISSYVVTPEDELLGKIVF